MMSGILPFDLTPQARWTRRMQIFAIGYDGNLYTMWKLTSDPNSAWSDLVSLGNPGTSLNGVDVFSVGYLHETRMQIFVVSPPTVVGGNIYSRWKLSADANSAWSDWTNLGSPGGPLYGPSVGYLPDGRMQIFLMGRDGKLYTMWKLTMDPNSGWSQWTTLGSAGPAYSAAQITFGVVVGYLSS